MLHIGYIYVILRKQEGDTMNEAKIKMTRGIALPYLKAWRVYKGLSQRDLSKLTGEVKPVPYTQISLIETHNQHVTPSTIGKLAAALELTREALINDDPTKIARPVVAESRPADAVTSKASA